MTQAAALTNVWEATVPYEYVVDEAGVQRALEWLRERKVVGYDLETTGLDCFSDSVVLMQLGNTQQAWVVDVRKVSIEPLREILEHPGILKLGHNIKFDYKFTAAQLGIRLENVADTMIAEKLLYAGLVENPRGPKEKSLLPKRVVPMGLAGVCERYLGLKLDKTLQQSFTMVTRNTAFTPEQLDYAAKDVQVLPPVWSQQLAELDRRGMRRLARIEMDAIAPGADMELSGWLIDTTRWRQEIAAHDAKAKAIGKDLLERMGFKRTGVQTSLFDDGDAEDINFSPLQSNPQLMAHFRTIGLELESSDKKFLDAWERETKKRLTELAAAGDESEGRRQLEIRYDFIHTLLEFRRNAKLVQTYGESLLAKIHPKTGRLHGELDPMGTETGRYASNNPNLQNFPKEPWVRQCFISGQGKVLATCDFSQIELRIVAQLSQDRIPIEAFIAGKDLHSLTASLMFGIPYEQFEPPDGSQRPSELGKKRNQAKTIVFGLAYGRGARSLAMQLGCSEDEAKGLMDSYFKTLPRVKEWLDKTGAEAWANGYATTMLGRRRYFVMPDAGLRDRDPELYKQVKGSIERQGKNHPIQGCNADIVKLALPRLRAALRPFGGRLISTVHDEIITEAAIEHADRLAHTLVEIMEGTAAEVLHTTGDLKVSTRSECNVGNQWIKERDVCVVVTDPQGVEIGIHHDIIQDVVAAGDGTGVVVLTAGESGVSRRVPTRDPFEQVLRGPRGWITVREACPRCYPGVFVTTADGARQFVPHHEVARIQAQGESAIVQRTDGTAAGVVKGDPEKARKRLNEAAKVCSACKANAA